MLNSTKQAFNRIKAPQDTPMFSSAFSGTSNGSDRLKQRSAVIDLKAPFNGKFNSFFPFLDKLKDHLSTTGVVRNCKVGIPTLRGDGNKYDFIGILKLQQIIDKRDELKMSLPDEIPFDAQGNAKHDDYITQWQERSWIYEGITKTLTDEVKAMIALDGIVLLFVLMPPTCP